MWKKEYQTPGSMAVIWSPDILTVAGKPPTRGFGGRIFFYNDKHEAIPVEGDVIVHGFRGEESPAAQEEADKTFAFTAEQLTSHYSPSQLGASYSIWIPWDAAGGVRDQVTLIPTFKSKEGRLVQGAAAKVILPGKEGNEYAAGRRKLPTQAVSYRQSTTPTNPGFELPKVSKESMRTTTIDVPNGASLSRPSSVEISAAKLRRKDSQRNSATLGVTGQQGQDGSQAMGGFANDGDDSGSSQTLSNGVQIGSGFSSSNSPSDPSRPQQIQGLQSLPASSQSRLPTINLEARGSATISQQGQDMVAEQMIERLNSLKLEDLPVTEVKSLPAPTASRATFQRKSLPNIADQVRQASFQSRAKASK